MEDTEALGRCNTSFKRLARRELRPCASCEQAAWCSACADQAAAGHAGSECAALWSLAQTEAGIKVGERLLLRCMACAPVGGASIWALPGLGALARDDDGVPEAALATLRARARRVLVAWRGGVPVPHGTPPQPDEAALVELLCCLQRNNAEIRAPCPLPWPQSPRVKAWQLQSQSLDLRLPQDLPT